MEVVISPELEKKVNTVSEYNRFISRTLEEAIQGCKLAQKRRNSYSDEVMGILAEAKKEHKVKKAQGYTREQAFQDLRDIQKEIKTYL